MTVVIRDTKSGKVQRAGEHRLYPKLKKSKYGAYGKRPNGQDIVERIELYAERYQAKCDV